MPESSNVLLKLSNSFWAYPANSKQESCLPYQFISVLPFQAGILHELVVFLAIYVLIEVLWPNNYHFISECWQLPVFITG